MNLSLYLGRTDPLFLSFGKSGRALDLTGCDIVVSCKAVQALDAPVLWMKMLQIDESGAAVGDDAEIELAGPAAEGRIKLLVTAADKAAMTDLSTYYWETLLVDAAGEPVAVEDLSGLVTVYPALVAAPAP